MSRPNSYEEQDPRRSLNDVFYFIVDLVQTDRRPDNVEWLGIAALALTVFRHGTDLQKRQLAKILQDGAEAVRDSSQENASKLAVAKASFISMCSPLLDSPASYANTDYQAEPEGSSGSNSAAPAA